MTKKEQSDYKHYRFNDGFEDIIIKAKDKEEAIKKYNDLPLQVLSYQ